MLQLSRFRPPSTGAAELGDLVRFPVRWGPKGASGQEESAGGVLYTDWLDDMMNNPLERTAKGRQLDQLLGLRQAVLTGLRVKGTDPARG